jgi:tripartite-type tricarboxylate transporter receptor subunit TctC
VDKLTGEIKKIMATDAFKRKAQEQGAYAVYMTPQELAAHTSKEYQTWGKFVKDAKIKGE